MINGLDPTRVKVPPKMAENPTGMSRSEMGVLVCLLTRWIAGKNRAAAPIFCMKLEMTAAAPEKIKMMREFGDVSLIVLDSLTGALNLTGAPGSRNRQRNLFTTLDSIRRVVNDIDAHMMITDHSSRDWTSGQSNPIGGNILAHGVDSVILVDRLRNKDNVVRILVERCTLPVPPPGVIVKLTAKGIRSIR